MGTAGLAHAVVATWTWQGQISHGLLQNQYPYHGWGAHRPPRIVFSGAARKALVPMARPGGLVRESSRVMAHQGGVTVEEDMKPPLRGRGRTLCGLQDYTSYGRC